MASGQSRPTCTTDPCPPSPPCSRARPGRATGPAASTRPTTTRPGWVGTLARSTTGKRRRRARTSASGSMTPPCPATPTPGIPSVMGSRPTTPPPSSTILTPYHHYENLIRLDSHHHLFHFRTGRPVQTESGRIDDALDRPAQARQPRQQVGSAHSGGRTVLLWPARLSRGLAQGDRRRGGRGQVASALPFRVQRAPLNRARGDLLPADCAGGARAPGHSRTLGRGRPRCAGPRLGR